MILLIILTIFLLTAISISIGMVLAKKEDKEGDDGMCYNATVEVSTQNTHLPPRDGMLISSIAFGSCFKPNLQSDHQLWKHFRAHFNASHSLWNWLGDNMYADSNRMNDKRTAYNAARDDTFYAAYGPVAEPKIPTTGTWDDHDYGWNNVGNNYACPDLSQAEFVHHFGIPESDPRHPAQGQNQRKGVYSAYMFARPQTDNHASTSTSLLQINKTNSTDNTNNNYGIHLINLDARSHRSPTFSEYGTCQHENSTMLGDIQWAWLEQELLTRTSEIKILASGTQVLPPLHRKTRNLEAYCAYDGPGQSFDQSIASIGEDDADQFEGTEYESWAELPQERAKLLRLVQRSIHRGMAKQILFISGDQHWAEITVKTIPATDNLMAVTVLEVTASGIDQNWPHDIDNTNRMQVDQTYHGVVTMETAERDENTCTDNRFHVCRAQANYGGIRVDWERNQIELAIYTPHATEVVAARVTLDF